MSEPRYTIAAVVVDGGPHWIITDEELHIEAVRIAEVVPNAQGIARDILDVLNG